MNARVQRVESPLRKYTKKKKSKSQASTGGHRGVQKGTPSQSQGEGSPSESSEVHTRVARDENGLLLKTGLDAKGVCGVCESRSGTKAGSYCVGCNGYFHMACLGEAKKTRAGPGSELVAFHAASAGYQRGKVPPIPAWTCLECRGAAYVPVVERMGEGEVGVSELAGAFNEYGLTLLPGALSIGPESVQKMHDLVMGRFEQNMATVQARDLVHLLEVGFTTFKLRAAGRYDLMLPELTDPSLFPELTTEAPWLPLVRSLLGEDAKCIHTGCMLSFPGSTTQQYHSDGDHESYARHKPVHCLNVFVPLVDLEMERGPTEFIPTSHKLGYYDVDEQPLCLTPDAGGVLLFDYRLKHRGRGNDSDTVRPVIYITYATPSFAKKSVANANFSKKRYHTLPDPVDTRRWRSRADRAAARQARF